jgi:glycosyltransferase involved in cell wall biosynthesis
MGYIQNWYQVTDRFKGLTLGVVAHKHFWGDPEGIKTTGGFGRQIEAFSRYFQKTILVVPFKRRHVPRPGYLVHIENQEIVPLPYFSGVGARGKLSFLVKIPIITCQIWRTYRRCDVVHYRMPGYVGILGLLVHKLRRARPGFVWLGTDWPERIRQIRDTRLRRLMAGVAARMLPWLMQDVSTFALGHMPGTYRGSHRYVHAAVSTVTSGNDIAETKDFELASPPRLLFVGRLAREKGLVYLIEAMAICKSEGVALDLTIVGEGSERVRIKKLTTDLDLEGQVHFEGFVPLGEDLWEFYRQADIFVLPSLSEGQGKVLIEAMASGLVVVATRVGGIPTIVEHDVNGLLVEPRLAEGIAEAIQRLLREPQTRRQLARNALALARKYTIEAQTESLMEQLLQDIQALGWQHVRIEDSR